MTPDPRLAALRALAEKGRGRGYEFVTVPPADLSWLLAALAAAEANYRFMVERAADKTLGGYRELAARAARMASERDEWQRSSNGFRVALDRVEAERDALAARLASVEEERDSYLRISIRQSRVVEAARFLMRYACPTGNTERFAAAWKAVDDAIEESPAAPPEAGGEGRGT